MRWRGLITRAVLDTFAEDITWHVPGRSPLSGDYRGHEEVVGFVTKAMKFSEGTLRVELEERSALNRRHPSSKALEAPGDLGRANAHPPVSRSHRSSRRRQLHDLALWQDRVVMRQRRVGIDPIQIPLSCRLKIGPARNVHRVVRHLGLLPVCAHPHRGVGGRPSGRSPIWSRYLGCAPICLRSVSESK